MTEEIRIITNNVPRDILEPWDLTAAERAEFDYLDWHALDVGTDSASFIRYRGVTYDLGEFIHPGGLPEFDPISKWDGLRNDSFFSGVVIRFVNHFEQVICGTFLA